VLLAGDEDVIPGILASSRKAMSFSRTNLVHLDLNLLWARVLLDEEKSTVPAVGRMHLAQSSDDVLIQNLYPPLAPVGRSFSASATIVATGRLRLGLSL